METYHVFVKYKKSWVGAATTNHSKYITVEAESIEKAKEIAINKAEKPSGTFNVNVLHVARSN